MLCEAEVGSAQGMTVSQVCCQLSISEQTYYRWRKQWRYENKTDQATERYQA